jgi:Bacteriocin-protection, YdeI or OmpD-Associated/Domain of unknown function (DUF1905)
VEALGGKGRTPVRATFSGVGYRGSIVTMGGRFVLGVTRAVMTEAGMKIGDRLDVVVEVDDRPREVELPEELRAALAGREELRRAWDTLSYSRRRESVRSIDEAKRPETRARRVATTLRALEESASS